jgi:23S rRNA pseudoU1915 N3-methylase RlmH
LNSIGQAELQKEIQIAVKKISEEKELADMTTQTSLELDEKELKKYLDSVERLINRDKDGKKKYSVVLVV